MVTDLTVSVALCTHNGERFIRDQLLSILGQTRLPDEIVLSDDASSDSTIAVATAVIDGFHERAARTLPKVVVLRNDLALGVTANFEQAILACSSELVALSDQDDVWEPNRLADALVEFRERPDLLLLHGDAKLIDDAGALLPATLFEAQDVTASVRAEVHAGRAFALLMHRNFVTGATTILRRKLADVAKPFPPAWLHDEWLAIIAAAVGSLDLTDQRLVRYRQHESNQLGAQRLSMVGKLRRMLEDGSVRNERLLARAAVLADRLPALDTINPEYIDAARRKLLHEQLRSTLGRSRLARILPVLQELRSGRYGEFGRGLADAVRDLSQPLKGPGRL